MSFEAYGGGLYEVSPEDIKRADNLFKLIHRSATDQMTADPAELAFLSTVLPELSSNVPPGFIGGRLLPSILQVYAAKRINHEYYPLGYDLRTLEVAVDKQARRLFPRDYPQEAVKHDFWTNFVYPDLNAEEIEWDMKENLRSNILEGYGVIKVMSQIFRDRWSSSPTVVDVGTSLGIGLKKWRLHRDYPFEPEWVLQAPHSGEPISPHLPPDEESQNRIDELTTQQPLVGKMFGIDILPVQPYEKDLVFSSTFPMMQSLVNQKAAHEFNELVDINAPDVELVKRHIDATDPESLSQLSDVLPGGKADIFVFSGIILQIPPDMLEAFFRNFLPYCNNDALFFANEWANVNKGRPAGLEMIKRDYWHKGQFKTFVIDPLNLDQPPVEFCRHLSRQCKQMYLSPAGRELLIKSF